MILGNSVRILKWPFWEWPFFWNIESQLYWSKLWERMKLTCSHLSLGFDRNFNWILLRKYICLQKQNLVEAPYTGVSSLFSCSIIQHDRELVPNSIIFLTGSNLCFQNWAVMVWHIFVLQGIPYGLTCFSASRYSSRQWRLLCNVDLLFKYDETSNI